MQDMKAMMDSLMGNDRNAGKRDEKKASFRDEKLCKNFMVWECPCDWFLNETGRVGPRSPFGECFKQHSEAAKASFKHDKDYRKFNHRYLKDLEDQLAPKIKAMDEKIAKVKEGLTANIEAEHAKLEKEGKLDADYTKKDEICDICGTYSAYTGGLIMRHEAGLLCTGWGRLRESFANLQKEVKASKEGLTSDELIGPAEEQEQESRKNREQRRDHRDGRKDADETKDRDRDRDRNRDSRRESDQKSRGRERDTHSDRQSDHKSRGRERDTNSERGRDRYDDRNRDRSRDRRRGDESGRGKQGRSRNDEEVDAFGRAKTIHNEYRDGKHPIREEDDRSRSRDARKKQDAKVAQDKRSPSKDASKEVEVESGSLIQDTEDCKILQINLSEDWQEIMNTKTQEHKLSMSVYDMTCIECDGEVLDMNAKDFVLRADYFPLKFKFTRKA